MRPLKFGKQKGIIMDTIEKFCKKEAPVCAAIKTLSGTEIHIYGFILAYTDTSLIFRPFNHNLVKNIPQEKRSKEILQILDGMPQTKTWLIHRNNFGLVSWKTEKSWRKINA